MDGGACLHPAGQGQPEDEDHDREHPKRLPPADLFDPDCHDHREEATRGAAEGHQRHGSRPLGAEPRGHRVVAHLTSGRGGTHCDQPNGWEELPQLPREREGEHARRREKHPDADDPLGADVVEGEADERCREAADLGTKREPERHDERRPLQFVPQRFEDGAEPVDDRPDGDERNEGRTADGVPSLVDAPIRAAKEPGIADRRRSGH